jgi:hypothetical protein
MSKTEKRNFKTNLALACGKDDLRKPMQYVSFKDGYVYATDAHLLVKQHLSLHGFDPEEIALMNGRCLHKDAFAELLRYEEVGVRESLPTGAHFKCKAKSHSIEIPLLDECPDGRIPNMDPVIPSEEVIEAVSQIGINLKLLERASKLLISQNGLCKFQFHGPTKGVLLTSGTEKGREVSYDYSTELVLVMPLIINI